MKTETTVLTYSNPRKTVDIPDWPTGSHKTRALFEVEDNKGKQRAVRTTWHPLNGRPNKPKKLTYAMQVVYVDGSDGRLYILERSNYLGHISIMKGTFDHCQETVYATDPRFDEIKKLFEGMS